MCPTQQFEQAWTRQKKLIITDSSKHLRAFIYKICKQHREQSSTSNSSSEKKYGEQAI
jgi:hypothetical protein